MIGMFRCDEEGKGGTQSRKKMSLEARLDLSHVLVTIGVIACVLFYFYFSFSFTLRCDVEISIILHFSTLSIPFCYIQLPRRANPERG